MPLYEGFPYLKKWLANIDEELESFEHWSKLDTDLSIKRRTEHTQRALERSVKFPFLMVGEFFMFIDPLLKRIFQLEEFNNTFDRNTVGYIISMIDKSKEYIEPKNLTHSPAKKILPFIREISKSLRKGSDGRKATDNVLKELVSGDFTSSIDAENYKDLVDIILEYLNDVESQSSISGKSSSQIIIEKTDSLISKVPDYNLMFLPFLGVSLRLLHTLFGFLALNTDLKKYESYIRTLDNFAASRHNQLADEGLDSEYFKVTYGFYRGIINLMPLFPLSVYLGDHYESMKYAFRDEDTLIEAYNNPSFVDLLHKSVIIMEDSVNSINSLAVYLARLL